MEYSTKNPKDVGKWCDVCEDLYAYCYHGNWENYEEGFDYLESSIDNEEYTNEMKDLNEKDIFKKINNKRLTKNK